jgi:hypothetical protein
MQLSLARPLAGLARHDLNLGAQPRRKPLGVLEQKSAWSKLAVLPGPNDKVDAFRLAGEDGINVAFPVAHHSDVAGFL